MLTRCRPGALRIRDWRLSTARGWILWKWWRVSCQLCLWNSCHCHLWECHSHHHLWESHSHHHYPRDYHLKASHFHCHLLRDSHSHHRLRGCHSHHLLNDRHSGCYHFFSIFDLPSSSSSVVASSLSSADTPGLSNSGAELELVLDSRFTSCLAGLAPRTPSIMDQKGKSALPRPLLLLESLSFLQVTVRLFIFALHFCHILIKPNAARSCCKCWKIGFQHCPMWRCMLTPPHRLSDAVVSTNNQKSRLTSCYLSHTLNQTESTRFKSTYVGGWTYANRNSFGLNAHSCG